MRIVAVGIDLGKTVFHLVSMGERNRVLVRRKFSRQQLLAYTANLEPTLIGTEACAGAHFLATELRRQGHDVRLMAAQFVKPYRKSNKSDFLDAEMIADAVQKENLRFVPVKSDEQLDLQAMHRVRTRLVQRRTALINEFRGFLLERSIIFPAKPIHLRKQLPGVLEDATQNTAAALAALSTCRGVEGVGGQDYRHQRHHRAHQHHRPPLPASAPDPRFRAAGLDGNRSRHRQRIVRSARDVTSRRGSGSFPDSTPRVARQRCTA